MVGVGVVGFMVREIEEGKKKRKKRECLVYLPVSFRRAISSCCYFSPALLSFSQSFFSPSFLGSPRFPVTAYYLSPSLSSRACLRTRDTRLE